MNQPLPAFLPVTLESTATDSNTIMDELNNAILTVQQQAMAEGKHGILVTRNSYTSFTIAISPDVPYGTTHDVWA